MRERICLAAFAAMVLFIVAFTVNDRPLPYSSQALQYECDAGCAQKLVAGYGENLHVARRGVYIDYGFLIVYAIFFATACLLAARGGKFWRLGYALAIASVVAAILDAIEGVGILQQLGGNFGWTAATCLLSKLKIAILIVVTVFLLARAAWLYWPTAKRLYVFLLPLRFTGLLLLVIAFAFLLSDQGYDVIANIAEDDPLKIRPPHSGQRVGFVFSMVLLALQAWYWSRHLLQVHPDEGGAPTGEFRWLTKWLPRLAGIAAFGIGLGALLRVFKEYPSGSQVRGEILWMFLYLLLALAAFLALVVFRRKTKSMKNEPPHEQKVMSDIAGITWILLGISTLLSFALFLFSTFAPQRTVFFGSAVIVTLSFALAVPIGSLLVYLGMRWKFPVLTVLLVWAVAISPFADNHEVRDLGPIAPKRASISETYQGWLARLKRERPRAKYPVFIVATEGGGIRAAYWTAIVLSRITDEVPEFPRHLFAISGVSGGSVGAAVYEGLLIKDLEARRAGAAPSRNFHAAARDMLSHDVLAPTLAAMTQPDLAQRFVPWPIFPDRASALEQGWERAWRVAIGDDLFSRGLLATMKGKETEFPSLFLNGTVVETGQRMTTSNCDTSTEVLDSIDFFNLLGRDIRFSTAAHNGARFTYVSPAGTLIPDCADGTLPENIRCIPGKPAAHIVDGGYFENSGAATALDILRVIAEQRDPDVQPYVLYIQYTARQQATVPAYANEALSPVRALLAVRGARGELAVRDLKMRAPFWAFELRETEGVTFPLGWLLADHTRTLMDAQMSTENPVNYPRLRQIAELLK